MSVHGGFIALHIGMALSVTFGHLYLLTVIYIVAVSILNTHTMHKIFSRVIDLVSVWDFFISPLAGISRK